MICLQSSNDILVILFRNLQNYGILTPSSMYDSLLLSPPPSRIPPHPQDQRYLDRNVQSQPRFPQPPQRPPPAPPQDALSSHRHSYYGSPSSIRYDVPPEAYPASSNEIYVPPPGPPPFQPSQQHTGSMASGPSIIRPATTAGVHAPPSSAIPTITIPHTGQDQSRNPTDPISQTAFPPEHLLMHLLTTMLSRGSNNLRQELNHLLEQFQSEVRITCSVFRSFV